MIEKHINDTLDKMRGTIQGDAIIELVNDLQEQIKNSIFNKEDISLEELLGSRIAITHLNKVIRRLEKEIKQEKKNEYL